MTSAEAYVLHGGCHCGRLRLEFATERDPAMLVPRACDCAFCSKHGAAYVSDPIGRLTLTATSPEAIHRYQQGSNTAQFLLCGNCGVLVAAMFEHEARLYGAVNAVCLEAASLPPPIAVSPQTLTPAEKVSRWLKLWIPDVEIVG